ncbi:hypothetical protein GTW25_11510 [Aliihoeflea aestuarii]|uniref:DUF2515 family protein n=1 Tax=Aliihoeflea aestuarii TaxID=453840 RepID=UPI002093F1D8|nr:hypothetical protein [Aliihoeflea aestuarii]MCO6391658.1 hypothetical protein [Aliihoeflea aestuarii]
MSKLAQDMPENDWVRLASYVSVQGGCAMQQTQRWPAKAADYVPFLGFDSQDSLEALGDANLTIFSSIYPPNRMVANCGYEKFRQCVESGEIVVDQNIVNAMEKMENGDRRGAANDIALHEQRNVVQPVYDRWPDTFAGMSRADALDRLHDRTSIPVAKTCTRDNLVPFEGDISRWPDRVEYYHDLLDRMYEIEGIGGR